MQIDEYKIEKDANELQMTVYMQIKPDDGGQQLLSMMVLQSSIANKGEQEKRIAPSIDDQHIGSPQR